MILAIDEGTTGTTCLVFDERAEPIGRAYREITQHFPKPGWVEHDAGEIWELTLAVAHEALAATHRAPPPPAPIGPPPPRAPVGAPGPARGAPLPRARVRRAGGPAPRGAAPAPARL